MWKIFFYKTKHGIDGLESSPYPSSPTLEKYICQPTEHKTQNQNLLKFVALSKLRIKQKRSQSQVHLELSTNYHLYVFHAAVTNLVA